MSGAGQMHLGLWVRRVAGGAVLSAALALTGMAQEAGPVTGLALPRFVSLKATEGFARRGPARSYRVDWIFRRQGMPLRVVAEYGHWRRVEDRDGVGGWMHYALLSGMRTVIVEAGMAPLRSAPRPEATPAAYAEAGVIARLDECRAGWCRITAEGARGWVREDEVWGADDDTGGGD